MTTQERLTMLLDSLGSKEYYAMFMRLLEQLTPSSQVKSLMSLHASFPFLSGCWTHHQVLVAFSALFQPKAYLEIGTFRGVSACCVAMATPSVEIWSYEIWSYDELTPDSGPSFISNELARVGFKGCLHHEGDGLLVSKLQPEQTFSLILVDGDHSEQGAISDLENTVAHVASDGLLVFDDIVHPSCPSLRHVWDQFKEKYQKEFLFAESEFATGCGIAMKK